MFGNSAASTKSKDPMTVKGTSLVDGIRVI